LLDREPPRLGVVQVKFYGGPETAHYVHKEYVLDTEGKPRSEFFLLCHFGEDESQKAYLLTAEEIHMNFKLTEQGEAKKFYLPYDQITANGIYEIKSRKLALDRIEHMLALAEFTANRRFVSWILPSSSTDINAILPEFKEPIANDWGDIPKEFANIKETAKKAMYEIEEIYNLLLKVADSVDPLEAEKDIEEIAHNCRDGCGQWRISLPDELGDEDFFNTCREHKGIVEQLKKDGLLDAFIVMQNGLKMEITRFLEPHYPVTPNLVHSFVIYYKPDAFILERVESRLIDAAEFMGSKAELDSYGHVKVPSAWPNPDAKEIKPGQIEAFWVPGRYGYTKPKEEKTWEKFKNYDFRIYRDCMSVVYQLKYGEPE
jgi:hypothetical protein